MLVSARCRKDIPHSEFFILDQGEFSAPEGYKKLENEKYIKNRKAACIAKARIPSGKRQTPREY